jgi:hypothetical protein
VPKDPCRDGGSIPLSPHPYIQIMEEGDEKMDERELISVVMHRDGVMGKVTLNNLQDTLHALSHMQEMHRAVDKVEAQLKLQMQSAKSDMGDEIKELLSDVRGLAKGGRREAKDFLDNTKDSHDKQAMETTKKSIQELMKQKSPEELGQLLKDFEGLLKSGK